MNVLKRNAVIVAALYAVTTPLLAQTSLDSLQHLPEVVVTERYGDREIRSSAPMRILLRKSIRNLNALQLSDVVKHFPGVTVKDFGGIGGLKAVSVRSLGASHTAVNYNGFTINDIQTGQIDIGRFALDNVDMISLNSGQSDNIFQPARLFASASVLNIQSAAPQVGPGKKVNGRASLKAGSFGMFNPAVSTNLKLNEKLSASLSGEWLSANGEYPYILHYGEAGRDSSSVEKRENTDVKNLRLEGALFANFSDKSSGNLRTYYYQSERGLPGATILYNTSGFSKQRLRDNTFFTQAHYLNNLSGRWALQANAKYNHGYVYYLDPEFLNAEGKLENRYRQNEFYGSVSALFRALENLSFSASTDVVMNNMSANLPDFAYPTRYTSLSSLAAKYVSDRLLATASLLYTQTSEHVRSGTAADNRHRLSPYSSLTFQPFEAIDFRLRAFYKNIFRLPTFNDLYYSRVGKRDLKPEDTHQFNIGFTYSTSAGDRLLLLTMTTDAYFNKINNKIVAYPNRNIFEWSMMNFGSVEIYGVDIALESAFALSSKVKLLAGSSFTFQDSRNKSNPGSPAYNHQLPYTPRFSGSGRAVVETPWLNAAYTLLWSGTRYTSAQNMPENRLSGYADHGISLSKSVEIKHNRIGLSVEALNLGNKNYEIVRNFPMPGRSFRGTISINF
ncbi:MAG: TonB-dependent receptor plug domain-containing protein [Petrimonas sp.]|nr:TonB-dependent receptor plug domain-containing protein [Petrimonas sp.]